MKKKIGSKIFCMILCFAMVFTQMSIGFADVETGSTGEASIKMSEAFDAAASEWKTGVDGKTGDEYTIYTISDVDDWLTFAACVNAGNALSGKTVELSNDIDFSTYVTESGIQVSLTPAGYLEASGSASSTAVPSVMRPFSGIFDGNGNCLQNILIDSSVSEEVGQKHTIGLFGLVKDGIIQNLKVTGKINVAYDATWLYWGGVGTITGQAEGKSTFRNIVADCEINADKTAGSNLRAGGIVGKIYFRSGVDITIENCENRGDITCNVGSCGGIVASTSYVSGTEKGLMQGCVNKGTIKSGRTGTVDSYQYGLCKESAPFTRGLKFCYSIAEVKPVYSVKATTMDAENILTTCSNVKATEATYMTENEINSWAGVWQINQGADEPKFTYDEETDELKWADENTAEIFRIDFEPYVDSTQVTLDISDEKNVLLKKGNTYYGAKDMSLTISLTGESEAGAPVYTTARYANGDKGEGSNTLTENTNASISAAIMITDEKNVKIRYGTREEWKKADDYTWYDETASSYVIKTEGQFRGFRNLVNSGITFAGKTVELDADLDVSDEEWVPIATFSGTFNGKNHYIKYKITAGRTSQYGALFGTVDGARIENLTAKGENKMAANYAAGIVGNAKNSVIYNCTNDATINIGTSKTYAAGIAANVTGTTIERCTNNGTISAKQYAAGIAAKVSTSGTINDCVNNGSVSAGASGYAGGIVASYLVSSGATEPLVKDCVNKGTVTSTGNYAGGIAGIFSGYMKDCRNEGTVTASSKMHAGGIAGQFKGTTGANNRIENCRNSAAVKAGSYVGGITGQNLVSTKNFKIEIYNCENTGAVTATTTATSGGISGGNLFPTNATATGTAAVIKGCLSYVTANKTLKAIGQEYNSTAASPSISSEGCFYLSSEDQEASEYGQRGISEDTFKKADVASKMNKAYINFWGWDKSKVYPVFNGFDKFPVVEISFVPFDKNSADDYEIKLTLDGQEVSLDNDEEVKYYVTGPGVTGKFTITKTDGNEETKYFIGSDASQMKDADDVAFTTGKTNTIICYGDEADFENFVFDGWYSDNENEFTIYTPGQFKAFANLVNSRTDFEGKTVKLGKDIDMSDFCSEEGESWVPIGKSDTTPFMGEFDGCGNTLSGIYIDIAKLDSQITATGIFGFVKNSTFKNLTITNSKITDNGEDPSEINSAGMLAGKSGDASKRGNLTVENVNIKDSVYVEAAAYAVGGLVGEASTSCKSGNLPFIQEDIILKNVANEASVKLLSSTKNMKLTTANKCATAAGGLIGFVNCGTDSYYGYPGGVKLCSNSGNVINESTAADFNAAGGLIGITLAQYGNTNGLGTQYGYLPVEYSYNSGSVTASAEANGYAGGIVGYRARYTKIAGGVGPISSTYNTGTVSGGNFGGISVYEISPADPDENYYVENLCTTEVGQIYKAPKDKIISVESVAKGALAYMLDKGSAGTGRLFNFTQTVSSLMPVFLYLGGNPVYKVTVNVEGIPEDDSVLDEKNNDFAEACTVIEIGGDAKRINQYITKSRTEEKEINFRVTPPEGYILSTVTSQGAVDGSITITDTEIKNKTTNEVTVTSDIEAVIAANSDLTVDIKYIPMPEDYGEAMTIVLDGNAEGEAVWTTAEGNAPEISVSFCNGDRLTEDALNSAIASAALSEIHRNRHVFTKWYADAECTKEFSFNQIITGYDTAENALTLYAGWEELDYTLITLNSNGSEEAPAHFAESLYPDPTFADRTTCLVETETGTSVAELEKYIPARDGYSFAGWFYDKECHLPYDADTLTEDAVLYAGWLAPDQCFITFDAAGGYFTADGVKAAVYVVKVDKAETTDAPDETAGDGGESGQQNTEKTIIIGELGIPAPKRNMESGNAFKYIGWTLSKDSGTIVTEIEIPTGSMTVYAVWEELATDPETGASGFEQYIQQQQPNEDGTFDEIVINDYETLKALAAYVNAGNNCEGRTFTLGSNITLSSDWQAIGSQGNTFSGTFQGNGNVITYNNTTCALFGSVSGAVNNVSISGSGRMEGGLAQMLNGGGSISGCTVMSGTSITSSGTLGGIVGTINQRQPAAPVVSDCIIEDGVLLSGGSYTGGIVGLVRENNPGFSAQITGCTVGAAKIVGTGGDEQILGENGFGSGTGGLGGIVGWGAGNITDCMVNAELTTGEGNNGYAIGGIVGGRQTAAGELVVGQCGFTGAITVEGEGSCIGGIVGNIQNLSAAVEIKDVYSTGTINVAIGSKVGGILGNNYGAASVDISNAYWKGEANVGGDFFEIAQGQNNVSVSNSYYCQNPNGDISGTLGTAASESDFTSGKITYNLNAGRDGDNAPWKQGAGIPDFEGKAVHKVTLSQDQIVWEDGNVTNITVSSGQYGNAGDPVYMTPTSGREVYVLDGETVEVSVDYVPAPVKNPQTGKTTTYNVTVSFENSDQSFTFTSAGTQSSSAVSMNMSASGGSGSSTVGEDPGTGGGTGGGSGSGEGSGSGDGTGDGTGDGNGQGNTGDDGQGENGSQDGEGSSNGQGNAGNGKDNNVNVGPEKPSIIPADKSEPAVEPAAEPSAAETVQQLDEPSEPTPLNAGGSQSGGGEQGNIKPESQIYKIIKKVADTVKENPLAAAAIIAAVIAIIFFGAWRRKKKEDKEQ